MKKPWGQAGMLISQLALGLQMIPHLQKHWKLYNLLHVNFPYFFFFLHIFVNILLNSHIQFKSTSLIITTKENQEKRMVFCAKQVLFQLKDVATQLFLIYLFLHFQWKYNGLHEGNIFLLSWVRKCVYK